MRTRPAIGSTKQARRLRAEATDADRAMWRLLKACFPESRFRRQVPLLRFVADFASHRARLVIEVDGGQHGGADDAERDRLIEAEGYRVVRFWNNDVLQNADGVAEAIAGVLGEIGTRRGDGEATPTPTLPHLGGGS